MSKVAIVLLNYNSTRYTRGCVRSIRAIKDENEYIVVVWDSQSEVPPTQKDVGECDLVFSSTNDGFAGGYNKAISYANKKYKPDYLLILNNDTRVPKTMIRSLIEVSRENHDKCLVVPKIYFEQGHEFHKSNYTKEERGKVFWYAGGCLDKRNFLPFHRGVDEVDRGQFDKLIETDFVTGCCILLTPAIWKKLGGFDERYFVYYEDIDLSIRAKRQGFKLLYAPKAHLYHINAGSSSGSGSETHQYYQTRNRLLFGLQYASIRTKLALLRESLKFWRSGMEAERLGVLHALEGRWGKKT